MRTLRTYAHVDLLALAALLAVATGLRLLYLNSGLWLDEILTLTSYARLPYLQIITTYDSENQHFLYSLLAHASLLLFGESPWVLRLPAVLFGVGSIAAIYFFGREVSTPREGFLAAALLTFSYHHVWFSQNARGYSAFLFWAIVSSWLFIRGIRQDRARIWVAYAIAAALGVYTHITMVALLLGQFIIYLAVIVVWKREKWRSGLRGISLGFGLAGILFVLLYAPVIPQMLGTIQSGHSVGNPDLVRIWIVRIVTIITSVRGGLGIAVALLAGLFVLGIGMFSYAHSQPIILGLLILPAAIGAAIVLAANHYLYPRFFFFLIGFAALVGVRAIMEVGRLLCRLPILSKQNPLSVGTVLVTVIILASALSVPFAYGPKQDYAGVLDFIQRNRQPGDMVVAVGFADIPYRDVYNTDWKMVRTIEELNALRSQGKRTWAVYTITSVSEERYPLVIESIRSDFSLVRQFPGTLGDGTIFVCLSIANPSTSDRE
jgi:mannosyltransferase